MDNLLFYTLLMVLLYYFFIYLPSQKKSNANNPPLQHHQATQTDTETIEYEPGPSDILNGPEAIKFPSNQTIPDPTVIQKLEKDIQEIKEEKIKELTEVEASLDDLIKNIQNLNQEIK